MTEEQRYEFCEKSFELWRNKSADARQDSVVMATESAQSAADSTADESAVSSEANGTVESTSLRRRGEWVLKSLAVPVVRLLSMFNEEAVKFYAGLFFYSFALFWYSLKTMHVVHYALLPLARCWMCAWTWLVVCRRWHGERFDRCGVAVSSTTLACECYLYVISLQLWGI